MGFDVVEIPGGAAGAGRGRAHQIGLPVTGRRGDVAPRREADGVVGRSGGVDRGRLDHGMNRVSVALGRRQGLQREDERALGPHVAVGLRIERMALAVRADDTHEVEAAAQPGAAQVGDGTDERLLAVAALERVHRRVQGAQACGTRRAVGDRRSHQVEVIGDSVGQHGHADAGDGVLADSAQRSPVGDGRNLGSDEDTGEAVAQRMKIPAGMLDGLPCAVQQHPDLRFGLHQLVVRQSEQGAVEEHLLVVADQSFPWAGEPTRPGLLANGPVALPVAIDDGLADDLPFAEQTPEVGVGPDAARHAIAVAGDGDRVSVFLCAHCVCVSQRIRIAGGTAIVPGEPVLPVLPRVARTGGTPKARPISRCRAPVTGISDSIGIRSARGDFQYRFSLPTIGNCDTRAETVPSPRRWPWMTTSRDRHRDEKFSTAE